MDTHLDAASARGNVQTTLIPLYCFAELSRQAFYLPNERMIALKFQLNASVSENLLAFIYQESKDLLQINLTKAIHMKSCML